MQHAFSPSKLNIIICAKCNRDMLSHTSLAKCESCTNTGPCELVSDILMCKDCQSRELEAIENKIVEEPKEIEYDKPDSAKLEDIAKSMLVDLPANGSEFYNACVMKNIDLEKRVMNDPNIPDNEKVFFLTKQIVARQGILYETLVKVRELAVEVDAERHANYRAINLLAQRLKVEEREALNIKYNEYKPQVAPKKVNRPRMSAEDKVIMDIARTIFAPKNAKGQISWEELTQEERDKYFQQAKQYYNAMFKTKK